MAQSSDGTAKQRKPRGPGRPFVKGDSRINRGGRPSVRALRDALREAGFEEMAREAIVTGVKTGDSQHLRLGLAYFYGTPTALSDSEPAKAQNRTPTVSEAHAKAMRLLGALLESADAAAREGRTPDAAKALRESVEMLATLAREERELQKAGNQQDDEALVKEVEQALRVVKGGKAEAK